MRRITASLLSSIRRLFRQGTGQAPAQVTSPVAAAPSYRAEHLASASLERLDRIVARNQEIRAGTIRVRAQTDRVFRDRARDYGLFLRSVSTMVDLDSRIAAIEDALGTVSGTDSGVSGPTDAKLQTRLAAQIAAIRSDLDSLKSEVTQRLQDTSATLNRVHGFMHNNVSLLISAVEVPGTIRSLQGEVQSLSRRTERLESSLWRTQDRRIAITSVIVAILSIAAALYIALFAK